MTKYPDQWLRLTEPRRALLWHLAHRPERTYMHMDVNQRNKQMLLALQVEGLVRHMLGKDRFYGYATSTGRALVAHVDWLTTSAVGDQLWAWIQSGPGLKTRADF